MFSIRLDNFLPFSLNLKLSPANYFSLEESKICRLVMGYTGYDPSLEGFLMNFSTFRKTTVRITNRHLGVYRRRLSYATLRPLFRDRNRR